MATLRNKTEISILNTLGEEILRYESPIGLSQQEILQKAVVHAAENRISLANAELKGLILNEADLTGLVLDGANLKGAVFKGCNLDLVSLIRANLEQSKIINTSMERAILDGALLNHAVLYKANLSKASIICTSFYGAQIRASDLSHAQAIVGVTSFEGAFIQNTTMQGMELDTAYFSHAIVHRSNMQDMVCATGQFQSTKFNLVDFANAQLNFMHGQDTVFSNSNINHAELPNCQLRKFILNDKQYGNLSNLPATIEHLQHENFQFVREPDHYKRNEMMDAIKLKDQVAINALIHEHRYLYGEHSYFDMQATSFKDKDLMGLKFQFVDFSGSDFSGANMNGTDLSKSVIDGAFIFEKGAGNYQGIILSEASAKNVFFNKIAMDGAVIYDTDLSYSKFHGVVANEINLYAANLYCTQFEDKTCFTNGDFSEARFNNVTANNATLQGNYTQAEITNSNFNFCDLSGSDFNQSDMKFVNLRSSDLSGVILNGLAPRNIYSIDVDLSNAQLQGFRPLNCEFKTTDFSHADASNSFFKNTLLHDVHLLGTDMKGTLFVDSKITMSNTDEALNQTNSMLSAAGREIKSEVCSKEQSQAYLSELKSLLTKKAPSLDSSGLDASF